MEKRRILTGVLLAALFVCAAGNKPPIVVYGIGFGLLTVVWFPPLRFLFFLLFSVSASREDVLNALSTMAWKTDSEIEHDIRILRGLPWWRPIFSIRYHLESFEEEGYVEARERQSTKTHRESIGLDPQIEYLYTDEVERRRRKRRNGRPRRSSLLIFPAPNFS